MHPHLCICALMRSPLFTSHESILQLTELISERVFIMGFWWNSNLRIQPQPSKNRVWYCASTLNTTQTQAKHDRIQISWNFQHPIEFFPIISIRALRLFIFNFSPPSTGEFLFSFFFFSVFRKSWLGFWIVIHPLNFRRETLFASRMKKLTDYSQASIFWDPRCLFILARFVLRWVKRE